MVQQYRRHRYPTEFPVEILSGEGKSKAQVIDVNETGARICGDGTLKRGDKVTIIASADRVTGVVRWAAAGRAGISFTPMISLRLVDALRYAKRPGLRQRFSSAGLQEMR